MSGSAVLLGGAASPVGWWVTFVERPMGDVQRWLEDRWFDGRPHSTRDVAPLLACDDELEPLESPWTKHLVIEHGGWTMLLGNSLLGGDPSAPGPAMGRDLDCRVVVAGHAPRHGPGHESTGLRVYGPDGRGPLRAVRHVGAHCADGRWSWHEDGEPLPFERTERYAARRIRDRFDRALLIEYLTVWGIEPDRPGTFGAARVIEGAPTSGRSISVAQRRRELGL